MNYRVSARHIVVEEDDSMSMVCFAEDGFSPSRFVILQRARVLCGNERMMGMDRIHIQVEDESRSNYGGISAIRLIDERLVISLTQEARSALRVEGDIEIHVEPNHHDHQAALSGLRKMCESDGVEISP